MKPILNWERMPKGEMLHLLSIFEAVCNAKGIESVSLADVARFFEDKGRPQLIEKFSPSYLRGDPA